MKLNRLKKFITFQTSFFVHKNKFNRNKNRFKIIIGEPDATIAFAGKRVIEEVMKIEVPEGVQEAEY